MLRGKSLECAVGEAEAMTKTIGLELKHNDYPLQLSGGMKRRLCLAMALIGGTTFIVLDGNALLCIAFMFLIP